MKVLFLHPNKWGRGVTAIWVASHLGILNKNPNIQSEIFDFSFYEDWTDNENKFNTKNLQYLESDYEKQIEFKKNYLPDLQNKIDSFDPDIIFWSAFSSHIHGEGEYASLENGYSALENVKLPNNTKLIVSGLQSTEDPKYVLKKYPKVDYVISGESEMTLNSICSNIDNVHKLENVCFRENGSIIINPKSSIIDSLDHFSPYDYSKFDNQILLRPYNGKVYKAIDYEISRGCIYSCSYCVETVIQRFYGFNEINKNGAIKNFKNYLRTKSIDKIKEEFNFLVNDIGIEYIRYQDTNFLTITSSLLHELADFIQKNEINYFGYIETRAEGINEKSIDLLKKLKIDGIGMGIELSSQDFRESELNRFVDQDKIINAFKILKQHNIKRTAYNVIGFPEQTEKSILDTIEFNKLLNPDNITVAYYSPYLGTSSQRKSQQVKDFDQHEENLDSQIRTKTKNQFLDEDKLNYYKENFIKLVRG